MISQFFETLMSLNAVGQVIVAIILLILVLAFAANVSLVLTYHRMKRDLSDESNKEERLFAHRTINDIVADYLKAGKTHSGEINTQAIIEKHFDLQLKWSILGERFIKTSVSLMIILGLVGTFFGLTMSIGRLVSLLAEDVNTALSIDSSIMQSLVSAMSGMSIAFVTSLFGISASIVMTLFNLLFNAGDRRVAVMVMLEEYLDNDVYKDIRAGRHHVTTSGLEGQVVLAEGQPMTVDALKLMTDVLVDKLYGVTGEMAQTVQGLQEAMEGFEGSLTTFADSARDFKEFNHHMKDNIQRMSLSFSDFTQEINHQTDKMTQGYQAVNNLTTTLKSLSKDS